jgi:hypothetical protein
MKGIVMQQQITPRPGGAAFIWKWGAIFGVILGVVQILISLLSLGGVGTLLNLVIWLVGFFLIGLFASRQTGRVRTGVLVGLVTGLIGGLIVALLVAIQITANGPQLTQAINQVTQSARQQGQDFSESQIRTLATVGLVVGLIFTVAIELGLGAGIGALGGLLGRRQAAPVAPAPYVEALWTPQQQPPMPPMPGERQE